MDDLPDLVDINPSATPCSSNHKENITLNGSDSQMIHSDSEEEYLDDEADAEFSEDFLGCQKTKCLMCSEVFDSPEAALDHMASVHSFLMDKVCLAYEFDQIEYIKIINYLRRHNNSQDYSDLSEKRFDVKKLDDSYMCPQVENDPLLTFDIESYLEEKGFSLTLPQPSIQKSLEDERDELRNIVEMQSKLISRMKDDLLSQTPVLKEKSVSNNAGDEDAGYFDSYSSYEIHQEMLQDSVRTSSYHDAIVTNPSVLKGSRVLDVGCGTGILSMFCARAGALSVDAVDLATVAFDAMEIVRTNNLEKIVTIRHGRLEQQEFAYKFDIIVSEWMGYFLLFEGMLDSVIHARDRFLKPGGTMMPNRCTMHITATDDKELYHTKHLFWKNVYGFDMSCISKKYVKSASTEVINNSSVATSVAQVKELDMNKCRVQDTSFSAAFCLVPHRTTELVALVGYFDTFFDLPKFVFFSTGPQAPPTHWKQTLFYLPQPLPVTAGEAIELSMTVKRMAQYNRGLEVTFTVEDQTLEYTVD